MPDDPANPDDKKPASSLPRGASIEDLLKVAGTLDDESAREMTQAIEEGCERVESADVWDRELEEDVEAGRLDDLAEKARRDHESGRSTEL